MINLVYEIASNFLPALSSTLTRTRYRYESSRFLFSLQPAECAYYAFLSLFCSITLGGKRSRDARGDAREIRRSIPPSIPAVRLPCKGGYFVEFAKFHLADLQPATCNVVLIVRHLSVTFYYCALALAERRAPPARLAFLFSTSSFRTSFGLLPRAQRLLTKLLRTQPPRDTPLSRSNRNLFTQRATRALELPVSPPLLSLSFSLSLPRRPNVGGREQKSDITLKRSDGTLAERVRRIEHLSIIETWRSLGDSLKEQAYDSICLVYKPNHSTSF